MTESKTIQDKCPFWAVNNKEECGISNGGMFIPLPEHITLFCLSSNYLKCRQYIRGCELVMVDEEHVENNFLVTRDRRRMRRFPEQIYLEFIISPSNNDGQKGRNYKAKTLDVSLGGLRVESFNELATDTVVSFILNPQFSSEDLLGVGEVKWCKPQNGTNKYESGISFSNYSTSEGMKQFLGL